MAKVSIATSSTSALAAASTPSKIVILENLGSNNVWCNIGATAVVDTGFVLKPSVGPYIFHCADFAELNSAINAIAETGATDISAQRI